MSLSSLVGDQTPESHRKTTKGFYSQAKCIMRYSLNEASNYLAWLESIDD